MVDHSPYQRGVSWLPLVWLCDSVIFLLPLLFPAFSHGWPMRPKNVQSLALCFTFSWSKNTLTTGLDPSSRSLKCHGKTRSWKGKDRFFLNFFFSSFPLFFGENQQAKLPTSPPPRSEQAPFRFAGVQRSSFVSIPWITAWPLGGAQRSPWLGYLGFSQRNVPTVEKGLKKGWIPKIGKQWLK